MHKRYRSLTMNWWRHFRHVLHKYANEDVSLGSWFIGLDVEHVDDRRLCCGTPPGTPDASPSVLAYLFPLPESVGVISMWCQWGPLTVSVVSLLHTAAYVISDLYGIIWGNLFAWSSWQSTSASRCAFAVRSMCLSILCVSSVNHLSKSVMTRDIWPFLRKVALLLWLKVAIAHRNEETFYLRCSSIRVQ